jgi:hypothetical protein
VSETYHVDMVHPTVSSCLTYHNSNMIFNALGCHVQKTSVTKALHNEENVLLHTLRSPRVRQFQGWVSQQLRLLPSLLSAIFSGPVGRLLVVLELKMAGWPHSPRRHI